MAPPSSIGRLAFPRLHLTPAFRLAAPRPVPISRASETGALRDLEDQLRVLRGALERLRDSGATGSRAAVGQEARAASVASGSPLELEIAATFTTLRSTEEVNAIPTSFGLFGPDWTGFGVSTAPASIGGTYLGTNGTGTLTFEVTQAGTHGVDDLEVEVFDPSGNSIQKVKVKKSDPIDQVYLLNNGLTLTLGAGDLVQLDDFHVDVDASVPTSFSPTNPLWNGAVSSAEGTIGGIYDGSDGTGTFTFTVDKEGVHGQDDLKVDVFRPTGGLLQTIEIKKGDPLDQVYTLVNGLTFTLEAGDLLPGDVFTIDAFDTVGSVVDPTKPFDGTRNDIPNFEPGLDVVAGSFEVNGVAITVAANDTIDSVLAKITSSAAGVTASFDAASERIVLTQQTAGSAPTITLANDTSGFLAATKLDSAVPVPGLDGSDGVNDPIADVPALSGISDGTFSVNGVVLSVDTAVDSLADVLDRINQSGAGVTASFDPNTSRVSIVSNDPQADLVLSDGTSGFFSALDISPGTYQPVEATKAIRRGFRDLNSVREDLDELRRSLDALFTLGFGGIGEAATVREGLREAISSSFSGFLGQDAGEILRSGFGLGFDFTRGDGVVELDANRFRRASGRYFEKVNDFLFLDRDDGTGDGLVVSLLAQVDQLQSQVAARRNVLSSGGRLLDLFV